LDVISPVKFQQAFVFNLFSVKTDVVCYMSKYRNYNNRPHMCKYRNVTNVAYEILEVKRGVSGWAPYDYPWFCCKFVCKKESTPVLRAHA